MHKHKHKTHLFLNLFQKIQDLLLNELTETVKLGLEVCWQFLTHRFPCSDRETVALHEAVTPRRPACRVIYIHLLGK